MEFYEVVKQILLVSFRLISKFNKTLLRILLCLVCEFHRQFSSLFDISRMSLHCVHWFFLKISQFKCKPSFFFLSFYLNLILAWFVMIFDNYAAIQKLFFLCSTFISPMIILTLSCTLVLLSARSSCI